MCCEVNLAIGDIVGADRGVLPLGRHSLMNGLGLRGSPKVSDEVFEDFAHALIAMFRQQGRLGSWGRDEARRLCELVGRTPGQSMMALDEWLLMFQRAPEGRRTRSVDLRASTRPTTPTSPCSLQRGATSCKAHRSLSRNLYDDSVVCTMLRLAGDGVCELVYASTVNYYLRTSEQVRM